MGDNLLEIARTVSSFREKYCPKCYHGKILDIKYDYEGAEKYLKEHNVPWRENVTPEAYLMSAEYHIKKNKDHETFWTVEPIPCPHKFCKFSEV